METPIFLILWLAICIPTSAYAMGGEAGGGGGAYVCRDTSSAITKVELVDLWEARETGGITIAYDNVKSPEDQARAAINRLGLFFPDLAGTLLDVELNVVPSGADVKWSPPDDVQAKFTNANCPLEGMMYYNDISNRLVVNPPVFNYMRDHATKTDMAAAYAHEIIYKVLRQSKDARDSVYARYIVGCLFSTDPAQCLNIAPPVVPKDITIWHCSIPPSSKKRNPGDHWTKGLGFSFDTSGQDGPIDANHQTISTVVFTRVGNYDLSKEIVVTNADSFGKNLPQGGQILPGEFDIPMFETRISGGLSRLGNPLGVDSLNVMLRAISYNPLTFVRVGDPESVKHPSRCQLVN